MAQECPVSLECTLFTSIDCGSHLLHVGQIVEIYADKTCLTDGKPDITKINPIVYAQSAYYDVGRQVDRAFFAGKSYKK
jgi:flavin reductase (DIM6/NTAB) family NADH-FMN oxidoreductase RutF